MTTPNEQLDAIAALQEGWQEMNTAPSDGTPFLARIPGEKQARIISREVIEGPDEDGSGGLYAWAIHPSDPMDYKPPPSWTDGYCWDANEDDEESAQPTGWRPLILLLRSRKVPLGRGNYLQSNTIYWHALALDGEDAAVGCSETKAGALRKLVRELVKMTPLNEQLDAIAALPDGWDGHGTGRFDPATIAAARLLLSYLRPDAPMPHIAPMSDGLIMLEWPDVTATVMENGDG